MKKAIQLVMIIGCVLWGASLLAQPCSIKHNNGGGPLSQQICISTSLQAIIFDLGVDVTDVTIDPVLLNGLALGKDIPNKKCTLSGIPTVSGIYTYTISTVCSSGAPETITGTITVVGLPSTADAGPDQTGASTCGLTTVTMNANAPTVGTGLWSIFSGTGGSFSDASQNNSNFTGNPGATYTLRWTVSSNPCTASSDNVTVTFNRNPSTAAAGPDQTGASTCGLTTVTLAATPATIGTGAWTVVNGSGGSFSNANSPTSTFTGTAGTAYTLRWTVSNAPCTPSTDEVDITFNRNPTTANAGTDQTGASTCGLMTVTLAANTPGIGTGSWSIVSGAGGSFGNANSPTSTFSGTAGVMYTLRWTIANAPCNSSTDDVMVKFNQIPSVAAAGADQTGLSTCGTTTVTLDGNSPAVGTGLWTVQSGTGGSFSNSLQNNSNFTGTAGNTYTLRWTISSSPCTASFDEVVITLNRNPTTANAGLDQTGASTCGLTTVTLAGNAATIGTGNWTIVSGTGGSFGNANSPTSTFTGSVGVAYTLRWTISNAPCPASSDEVDITLNRAPTTSNAGPDQTGISTCGLTTVTLAANNPTVGTGTWTITSGTGGSFSNQDSPTSTFSGTAGVTYTLRWTISNAPCNPSFDEVAVKFNQIPTISVAGPDQTDALTCGLTTVTLAGNSPSVGTGSWTIVSGTGGSFANANSPTSTFSGTAGNTYTLRWTISNAPCAPSSDEIVIKFNRNPSNANAGLDQTGASTCGLTTVTLAGNNPTVGTGNWTVVSGSGGTFSNANLFNSTFSGVAGNAYTLRWTISNSPCTPTTDEVDITFNRPPTTANAGPDQTGANTCGLITVSLAANPATVGVGLWSVISGAGGSFNDANSPTSTFTGTAGASYTLRWTITNAPCAASSDDVLIKFNQIPTVSTAGADQIGASTCGLTSLALEGNIPTIGTGLWTVIAGVGGSFSNSSFANSTFTGTAGTTYTLRWTITNSPCVASLDDVVIKFNQNPTNANAGPDQTGQSTCGLTSVTLAGNPALVGTGNWTIVNGNGGSLNNPANPTTTFTGTPGVPYTLRWTITNSPCGSTFNDVDILLNQAPTISAVSSTNPTTCAGTEGTIKMNGLLGNTAYLVDFNRNGVPQAQQNITTDGSGSLVIASLNKGTYNNLSATLLLCKGTNNSTITLQDPPLPAVPGTSQQTTRSECASTFPFNLNVNPISGIEMNWYKDGISFTNNQNSISISAAGIYEVEAFNPTSKCNSATKLKFTITSVANPVKPTTANNSISRCQSQVPFDLSATPPGGASIEWFNISNGGSAIGSGNTLAHNNVAPNVYTYFAESKLTAAPNCRSLVRTDITVTINPTPTAPSQSNDNVSFCQVDVQNGTSVISATPPGGATINWYSTATGGVPLSTGSSTFLHNNTVPNTYSYFAESELPTGPCKSTSRKQITVTIKPTPTMGPVAEKQFCAGDMVKLNFASTPFGSSFSWKNSNIKTGLMQTEGMGDINFNAAANSSPNSETSTIKVTPTLNQCVGAEIEYLLTLKPTPQLVPLPTFSECSGLPFNLLDFSINPLISGTQNYSWSNSGVPGLAGSGNGQIPIFTPAANTTGANILGKITYIVTVTGCASAPKTYDVIIFPQPQLNLTLVENSGATPNDGVVCETDQISIQAAATLSPSPFQFLWNNGNTTALLIDNPAGVVSKSYTVTVTDNNGCKNTKERAITINKYPKVDISFVENSGNLPNDAQICSKDLIDLTANESNGSNSTYTFDWNATTSKSKNVTLNPTVTGKQNYIVTVTNSGCKTTAIKEIEVFGLPVSGFKVLSTQLEIDKSITFENISTKFGAQDIIRSKWTFGGSEFDSIVKGSPNPLIFVTNKFKEAGNQDITLKVTDNKGCMHTSTQTKFVNLPGCVTSPNKPVPYDGDKLCWNTVTSNYALAKPRIKLQVVKTGGTSSYKAKWVLPSGIKFIGTDVLVQGDSVKNRDFEFEVDTTILPNNKEFNLRIEATDVSNCPNQNIDIPYIILAPLRGSLLFTPKSICNKTTADLKIQSGSTAPFTYTILRDNLTKTGGFSKADTTIVISNPDYILNNNVFFLKELRDSFGCNSHPTKFDSAVLMVNPLPSFSIDTARCLPGNNQFYISFAIKNGKSPYSFVSDSITKNKGLAGAIVGNQFVSDTILSKDGGNSFLIKIIDALGCKDSVKSSIDCKGSCSIIPGVFKSDTIKKCDKDNNDIVVDFLTPASGVTNGGNYFILVKENNLTLTTLILNKNLVLYRWKGKVNLDSLKPRINLGEYYHIYETYGSDSSAVKNLNDACLRITAVPKPIIFNNLPTIQTIKFAKDKICDGDEVDLNIRFTGSVPITFDINNKRDTFDSLNDKIKYGKTGSDGYGNATSFEPKITYLEDKNGCKGNEPGKQFDKVTINPLPVITALSDLTFCKNKKNDVITVTHNTILNRTYIYKWTFPDTTNIRIKNQNTKTITIDLINDNVDSIPFKVKVTDGTTGCIDTMIAAVRINDGSSAPEIDTILKVKGNKSLDSYVMVYPDFSLCYEWQVDTTGTGDFSAAKNCNDGNGLAYCEYRKEFLNSNTKFQVKIWKKDGTNCDKNKACSNIATIVREGTLGGGVADPLQLILHPNPNEGEFNITLAGGLFGNYRATIIDNVGRIVHRGQFEKTTYESKIEMNHSNLSNGIYFLQLRDQEGNYFNLKFIVQH